MENVVKYIVSLIFGILAALEPTILFAVILFFAILLDCLSAYDLSRRLAAQFPDKYVGKFQSKYALKMLKTFIQAYTVIILLHMIDVGLTGGLGYWHLSNIGAAIFCGIQLWSVLENMSSGNGAKWAKILQRVMVSKISRHLDVDLEEKVDEKVNEKDY